MWMCVWICLNHSSSLALDANDAHSDEVEPDFPAPVNFFYLCNAASLAIVFYSYQYAGAPGEEILSTTTLFLLEIILLCGDNRALRS